MLTPIASPSLLTASCHQYSARVDLSAFDPKHTPRDLGVVIPARLATAVAKRQAEFIAGRYAAMAALRSAGFSGATELAILKDRSPAWPTGFVGTITHTTDYVSAAVARSNEVRALGRDTERLLDEATAQEIESQALSPVELKRMEVAGYDPALATSIVFSAKESLYKALAPIVKRFFDFSEAEVIGVETKTQKLRLALLADLDSEFRRGTELSAQYLVSDFVHTAVEVALA